MLRFLMERYGRYLKPTLFRRIHVGTMHYMGEAHEEYRRAFEFMETTNTWNDTDVPWRGIPYHLKSVVEAEPIEIGCDLPFRWLALVSTFAVTEHRGAV